MIHPLLEAAAAGTLPDWARASAPRREHARRVADLMGRWAVAFGLDDHDVARWRAAAFLHDALRDADAADLRPGVDPDLRGLPAPLLHGPAAAARLRQEGVRDEPLLLAVAWHTLGHPDFDRLGRALYLADYLEPGRPHHGPEDDRRRDRVAEDLDGVLRDLAAQRICHALRRGAPLHDATVRFWNGLAHG